MKLTIRRKSDVREFDSDNLRAGAAYLGDYADNVEFRAGVLRNTVADEIVQNAEQTTRTAISDDYWLKGAGWRTSERVSAIASSRLPSPSANNEAALVSVSGGEDLIFAEFGTGVYYNGTAGSSPHPKGSELGATIGSYGKGYGKKRTWGFKGLVDGVELTYLTHGVPAQMPVYKAVEEVAERFPAIAKEVFGR